jgi:hypothetical protein
MRSTIPVVLKSCFAAIGIGSLVACVTQNKNDIQEFQRSLGNSLPSNFELSEASGRGVAIASIISSIKEMPDDFPSGRADVYYRKIDLSLYGTMFKQTFLRGKLVAVELPAGDYEVYDWSFRDSDWRITPVAPFSVRFHVTAGKAIYLGSYNFQRTFGGTSNRGMQDRAESDRVEVIATDESERDLEFLSTQYPQLTTSGISSSMEKRQAYNNLGDRSKTDYAPSDVGSSRVLGPGFAVGGDNYTPGVYTSPPSWTSP